MKNIDKLKNLDLTEDQIKVMLRMNERALKLARIESHFSSKKVPIDTKYLDTLSDEDINEIYENHCTEYGEGVN